jgi:protein gp37
MKARLQMANKQGENGIDWTDWTWNVVKGKCAYGRCFYCYMKRMPPSDPTLRFVERELHWKPRQPCKVFVGSSLELLDPAVPSDWIQRIIDKISLNPEVTYQFLSKNPRRYAEFNFPENCWLGTTWDGLRHAALNIEFLEECAQPDLVHFVSFEPVLSEPPADVLCDSTVDWIIIGADSNDGAVKPPDRWADILIEQARLLDIPVWVKDNYRYAGRIKEAPSVLLAGQLALL